MATKRKSVKDSIRSVANNFIPEKKLEENLKIEIAKEITNIKNKKNK